MKRILTPFAAILFALVLATSAQAIVLTFDDIGVPNSAIPGDNSGLAYKGFQFSSTTDVIDISSTSIFSDQGPTAISGDYAAINNYGGPITITQLDNGTFNFNDLFIRSYGTGDLSGSITAYAGGVQVGQALFTSQNIWNDIQANFTGIDTLVISVIADPLTSFDSFLLDNIRINEFSAPTAVPEPSSLLLIGGGLAGLVFWRRRKQQ